jgi:hypothetical protein
VIDESWLVEAVDEGGEDQRVQRREHGEIVAIDTHNLK